MLYALLNYDVAFSGKAGRAGRLDVARGCIGGIVDDIGGAVLAADGRADSETAGQADGGADCAGLTIIVPIPEGAPAGAERISADLSARLSKALPRCRWQVSYQVLSVTQSVLSQIERYLIGEMERHEKFAFQEELINLLAGHGIACDVGDLPA